MSSSISNLSRSDEGAPESLLRDARARSLRSRSSRAARRSTFLLPSELPRLLDEFEPPAAAALVALLAGTGLQLTEALALTRGDLRFRRRVPVVQIPATPATNTRRACAARSIPLVDPALRQRLEAHMATVTRGQGSRLWPITRQTAASWLAGRLGALRDAGDPIGDLPVTLASLRTGFAVVALVSHVPAPVVQRWLGLRRRESLGRYERLLEASEHELMARLPHL